MESLHRIFSFTPMSANDLAFNRLDFWIFFLAFMVLFSFLHKQQLVRSMFITVASLFLLILPGAEAPGSCRISAFYRG